MDEQKKMVTIKTLVVFMYIGDFTECVKVLMIFKLNIDP